MFVESKSSPFFTGLKRKALKKPNQWEMKKAKKMDIRGLPTFTFVDDPKVIFL